MGNEDLDWARDVVAHIGGMVTKWGRLYDVATDRKYRPDQIASAITIYATAFDGENSEMVTKEELTKANRQTAAAKARASKAEKKLKEALHKLASLGDS